MQKDIEGKLKALQIESKERRKRSLIRSVLWLSLLALFFIIPSLFPSFSWLFLIDILVILFGAVFVLDDIDYTVNPLSLESRAFQKIARCIELLQKSNEEIVHEEAYRCLKKAYKILKKIDLASLGWYEETNKIFHDLLSKFELIILPAVAEGVIITEDLEKIALAIYNTDAKELKKIFDELDSKESYKNIASPEKIKASFLGGLKENKYVKILSSLIFGYGLVLIISLIYVIGTQQDFMIFAIDNPEIIVLGGLGASGIAVWKIKS